MKLAAFVACGVLALAGDLRAQQGGAPPGDVLARSVILRLDAVSPAHAVEAIARAAGFRVSYSAELMPPSARISLDARPMRVDTALARVLGGTGLRFSALPSGLVIIEPVRGAAGVALRGIVRDAVTGAPVRDALVTFDDGLTALSSAFGEFRAAARAPGSTVVVRRLGYQPARAVLPPAGDSSFVVQLRAAAVAVDRVIVMGSTEGMAERSFPGALTVITGDELARLDLRRIEDVFAGMIPGVVGWDGGPGSTMVRLGSIRGSSSFAINYFKTYVDGVEVAAPFIVTGVDPATIERIEVIRGPQGAALYGSDASSGVVQITTRRAQAGRAIRPRFDVAAARGARDSRFIDRPVRVHSYQATIEGRLPGVSYSAGGMADGAGHFIAGIPAGWNVPSRPAPGTPPVSGGASGSRSVFGTAHFAVGPVSGALSSRRFTAGADPAPNPVALEQGFPIRHVGTDLGRDTRRRTSSISLRYAPLPSWSVRATGGHDETVLWSEVNAVPFLGAADSVMAAAVGTSGRGSGRLTSEFRANMSRHVNTTVTLGAERARISYRSDLDTGAVVRQVDWATGAFAQANVSVGNLLSLTAGIRSEANTGFGAEHGRAMLPLAGVALARTAGDVTLKLRGAYGRGIRPPPAGAASGGMIRLWQQLPNPLLGPESQGGSEYGVDLYVAAHSRVHVTRFDQVADGLIQVVPVNLQSQPKTLQQQNIGAISNRGWETEAHSGLGPVTVSAHYSRTDSRVRSMAPRYTGALRPGDRMLEVPAWTGALTSSLDVGRVRFSTTAWRAGDWVGHDWVTLYRTVFVERRQPGPVRNYWVTYPGFTLVRAAASVQLWGGTEMFVRGENLGNDQDAGRDNLHPSTGRTLTLGLRGRY